MDSREVVDIGVGEYSNRILNKKGEVWTYQQGTLLLVKYALPEAITHVSAGHPWANAIGVSGKTYQLANKTNTYRVSTVTDGLVSDGYWDMQAVVKKNGGISLIDNNGTAIHLKAPTGSKLVAVAAGHFLLALDEMGRVWQYNWCTGNRVFLPIDQLQSMTPVVIPLPGPATRITSSRTQHCTALVNGEPWSWCTTFGAQYIGAPGAQPAPVNMTQRWGLKEKLIEIKSSDNTTHMITVSSELLGMGDGAIGEVGNGAKHPLVIADGTWPMERRLFFPVPVNIGRGRKYDKLAKGNSYGFRNFARETNGFWSSWGYGKGGLPMYNGIRPANDTSNVADASVAIPWRITIAPKETIVSNEQLSAMVATGAYPYKEPVQEIPDNVPPVANAGQDILITLPVSLLQLNGLATDVDGLIKTILWKQESGPEMAVVHDDDSLSSFVSGLVEGDYEFSLTITDDKGATVRDIVGVRVQKEPVSVLANYDVLSDGSMVRIK